MHLRILEHVAKLPTPPTVRYGFTPFYLRNLFPNTKYFWKPTLSNESSIFSSTTARERGDHTPFVAVAVDLGLKNPLMRDHNTVAAAES